MIGRASRGLLAAQVAIATVLVVMAGLAVRSLARMTVTDPGLVVDDVLVLDVVLPPWDYASDEERVEAAGRVKDAASRVPGVTSVALVQTVEPQ